MPVQLTTEDASRSLNAHLADKGAEIHAKYGPQIGWNELLQILDDRECARYPCVIAFDDGMLHPGEFAHPAPNGENPEEGFTVYVHPVFKLEPLEIPLMVLYQLVLVNYGEFASADDAETFGASALGLSKDDYYTRLCELADRTAGGQGCQSGCECNAG